MIPWFYSCLVYKHRGTGVKTIPSAAPVHKVLIQLSSSDRFHFSVPQNSMNLPPDKVRLLRSYDNEKKWELICDQVGGVYKVIEFQFVPAWLTGASYLTSSTLIQEERMLECLLVYIQLLNPKWLPGQLEWCFRTSWAVKTYILLVFIRAIRVIFRLVFTQLISYLLCFAVTFANNRCFML